MNIIVITMIIIVVIIIRCSIHLLVGQILDRHLQVLDGLLLLLELRLLGAVVPGFELVELLLYITTRILCVTK